MRMKKVILKNYLMEMNFKKSKLRNKKSKLFLTVQLLTQFLTKEKKL
jgi:hypothetical protein